MKYVDVERLTKEIDNLYNKWCGNSTGFEVAEEGASIGTAESIFEEVRKTIEFLQQEQTDFPTTDEQMKEFLATRPKIKVPEKYKNPDWLFKKQDDSPGR